MIAASDYHPRSNTGRLLGWLGTRNGVAHTSDARADGFTGQVIAAAVATGHVERVRRSWLVARECDPRRRAAAAVSGRVTCVSAAGMRGLWLPADTTTEIHVAVASTASRIPSDGLHLHWGRGPAPVGRNATEEPLVNVLFHVAHCLPERGALAVWESAVRKGMAEPDVLQRVAWRSPQAAALASGVSMLSDSGLETIFVDGMRRAGVVVRQQVWIDGHPVDGLIGTSLVTQIDGFAHHSSAADRRRDLEADARLTARGYTVLRFDYWQVLFAWHHVAETIQLAMAQGAHLRRSP